MALSPQDEALGLKAYEQARAFERMRSWRLPVTFIGFAAIPVVIGAVMWALKYFIAAWVSFGVAVLLSWIVRFQWNQLQARYARNMRMLAQLEAEHGEALPWVRVEKHFAELEKLKRELAEESSRLQ